MMRLMRSIFSCKRIALTLLTIVLLFATYLVLFAWIPFSRAINYERAYFAEVDRIQSYEHDAELRMQTLSLPALPVPLIHDVAQLRSWGYEEQLGLFEDGTAKKDMTEIWIYVGGKAHQRSWYEKMALYSSPGGSCVDEGWVCDAFNEGFDHLMELSHTHIQHDCGTVGGYTSSAIYAFMDCDVSPLLCDHFYADPVMLIHLKTTMPCRMEMEKGWRISCAARWSLVGLPLTKMPFSRTLNVGGHVVPVFPSAEEQMRAMVFWDGSQDGIGLSREYVLQTVPAEDCRRRYPEQ